MVVLSTKMIENLNTLGNIEMSNNLFIVAGLHGSGKTTLINKMLSEYNEDKLPFIYNPESKFAQFCRDTKTPRAKIIRTKLPEIILEEKQEMIDAISNGRDIFIDRTCLSVKGRIIFRENSRLKNFKKICHFILPPQNEDEDNILLERLKKRDQFDGLVSPDGIKEAKTLVQLPNLDEGYDKVCYYNITGSLLDFVPTYSNENV